LPTPHLLAVRPELTPSQARFICGRWAESTGQTVTAEVTSQEPGHGAAGGGVSMFFAMPAWLASAHVPNQVDTRKPGRGVPTSSRRPSHGYRVRVDGQGMVTGGTSRRFTLA
jgi:kumamolisin